MLELQKEDYENLIKLLDRLTDIKGIVESRIVAVLASKLEAAAKAADAPAFPDEPVEEPNDDLPTDN